MNINSLEAYHGITEKEVSQLERVFQLIKKMEPVNSRALATYSGIERSAAVARINKLKEQKRIDVAFTEKCKITNKLTDFYQVIKPKVEANPGTQSTLTF